MPFQERQNWSRNELGVYTREASSFELVLPPDFEVTHQSDAQRLALYERRFFGQRGSSLFFMVDPTIHRAENIQTSSEVTERDRGPVNALLRAQTREAEKAVAEAAGNTVVGLLVNPQSVSISLAKSFSQAFARAGWTISHDYVQHPQIQLTGQTGGFYTAVPNPGEDQFGNPISRASELGGLTRREREWSGAYQNLLDMVSFFKQNGAVRRVNDRGRIRRIMRVFLFFEGWSFVGHFTSFNISEAADRPFQLNYSIAFEAHEMYHSTWPQTGQVVQNVAIPDDLRRAEKPETILGDQPRNREKAGAEELARAQRLLTYLLQATAPVAVPEQDIRLVVGPPPPVLLPLPAVPRVNIPDITNTAQ